MNNLFCIATLFLDTAVYELATLLLFYFFWCLPFRVSGVFDTSIKASV